LRVMVRVEWLGFSAGKFRLCGLGLRVVGLGIKVQGEACSVSRMWSHQIGAPK